MMPKGEENVYLNDEEEAAEEEEGRNSSEPVKEVRQGRRRSHIWKHFVKTNNGKSAKCFYCSQTLSFAGSLSNLLRHLRKKHPSIASTIHLNHSSSTIVFDNMDSLIVEMDDGGRERILPEPLRVIKQEQHDSSHSCAKKLKAADIEFVLKRDHSYVEQSPSPPQPQHQPPQPESLFAQFIQMEINKFHSEYLKRKCKREILQALMKYQQAEDELYSEDKNNGGDD